MKNSKLGFTLVETLVMMAIIGIIATVTVVSLKGMRPDKDKMMIKKAYSTIVQIVDALINDTELYPYAHVAWLTDKLTQTKTVSLAMQVFPPESEESKCKEGEYDKTNNVCLEKTEVNLESFRSISEGTFTDKKSLYEDGEGDVGSGIFTDLTVRNNADYTSENKFAYNFVSHLDTSGWESPEGRYCWAYTKDGMSWAVTDFFDGNKTDLSNPNSYPSRCTLIKVDINGDEIGPNSSTDSSPDIYTFIVDVDGHVSVYGDDAAAQKAKKVLKSRDIKASK